jgi:large subunit ribosomal protein L22
MAKPKTEKNWEGLTQARHRYAGMTARKARLVVDLIRGKSLPEAIVILDHLHKPSACPAVKNVLKSAAANAGVSDIYTANNFFVSAAFVDGAPMMKRMRPAPMGRGVRVRKRLCHITIRLSEI